MTRAMCLVAAVVLLAGTTTFGKDPGAAALEEAKALAAKGDALGAAGRFGDVVAAAQAAGDLQAEQAAAEAFESWFDKLPADAAGDTKDRPTRAAVLTATLRKLDASRCGAFVSAPVLARNVLRRATETGDFAAVPDAAKVAAAHASKATSGRAAAVVAKYAEGMRAVAEGRFADATAPLDAAAAEAVKAGWIDLAAHACTELAATWLHEKAPDKAAAAVAATVSACETSCGPMFVGEWQTMLAKRAPDGPEGLRKPLDDLMARITAAGAGRGSGGSGASGAPGAPGGSGPRVSPIGKLLAKLPKGKAFVSTTRSAKGFELRWTTAPDAKPVSAFDESGVTFLGEGGVWLAFLGRGVALMVVDPVGNRGGFGGTFRLSDARAYYLLAEGETWNVSKDGVVTITR
jgi:hypothetical protein